MFMDKSALVGVKLFNLLIVEVLPNSKVRCICDCGNITVIRHRSLLITQTTKSCGCIRRKHGLSKHPLFSVWIHMRERCTNSNHESYENYGGRGIYVCKEWDDDFNSFYGWALNNGWGKGLELDRIDNDKEYSPNNCRIVTRRVNSLNRRSNRLISFRGKTQTLIEWCREFDFKPSTIGSRLINGWSIEQALSIPARRIKAK